MVIFRVCIIGFLLSVFLSCEVLVQNPYDNELAYLQHEIALKNVPDNIREIILEPVSLTNGTVFFVLQVKPNAAGNARFYILDSQLRVKVNEESGKDGLNAFTSAFITHLDNVQIGNILYDFYTQRLTNTYSPDSLQNNNEALPHPMIDKNTYYIAVKTAGANGIKMDLVLQRWVSNFIFLRNQTVRIFSDNQGAYLLRTRMLRVGDLGSMAHFIFQTQKTQEYYLLLAPTSSLVSLRSPLITVEDNVVKQGLDAASGYRIIKLPYDVDVDSVILSTAGVLLRSGKSTLIRIDENTGAEKDRFSLSDYPEGKETGRAVVFDPKGQYYLLFNVKMKRMYRVGKWW